jgi:broad specificity phosphatase PhoE
MSTPNIPSWAGPLASDDLFEMQNMLLQDGPRNIKLGGKSHHILGRSSTDATVTLVSPSSSGVHALLVAHKFNGLVYIIDLNSNHGTHIDGCKLPPNKPTKLKNGHEVRFGAPEGGARYKVTQAPSRKRSLEAAEEGDPAFLRARGRTIPPPPADMALKASCELIIIRHAERLDEVPGHTWYRDERHRWFDPPITREGVEHAEAVAEEVLREMGSSRNFDVIHCSPLLRAVQTAEVFSEKFNCPIQIVPGLCECASAVKEHGLTAQNGALYLGRSGLAFQTIDQLKSACPRATWTEEHPETVSGFKDSVAALCDEACNGVSGKRVCIVSHREGIWDLSQQKGIRTPYCCVAHFVYGQTARGEATLEFVGCRDLVKFQRRGPYGDRV